MPGNSAASPQVFCLKIAQYYNSQQLIPLPANFNQCLRSTLAARNTRGKAYQIRISRIVIKANTLNQIA